MLAHATCTTSRQLICPFSWKEHRQRSRPLHNLLAECSECSVSCSHTYNWHKAVAATSPSWISCLARTGYPLLQMSLQPLHQIATVKLVHDDAHEAPAVQMLLESLLAAPRGANQASSMPLIVDAVKLDNIWVVLGTWQLGRSPTKTTNILKVAEFDKTSCRRQSMPKPAHHRVPGTKKGR